MTSCDSSIPRALGPSIWLSSRDRDRVDVKSVLTNCVLLEVLRINTTDLHAFLYSNSPDVVFVTESWLNDSDGVIDPSVLYSVNRHDDRVIIIIIIIKCTFI